MTQQNSIEIDEINRLLSKFQSKVGELSSLNILLENQVETLTIRLKAALDELEELKADRAEDKEPATASDFV